MMKFHTEPRNGYKIAACYEQSVIPASADEATRRAVAVAAKYGIPAADVPIVGDWYRNAANSAWPDWRRLDAKIARDIAAAATREEIQTGASLEQIAARLGFG